MDCDRYLELLALHLDGELSEEEDRERNEHLAVCPDCRAAGAQLAALQGMFGELEEVPAPEGFTQSVMDRIRAVESPKVIPLFKRPQFRALAGLAACLVMVAGIYSVSRHQNQEKMMLITRNFQQDVLWEETVDGAGDVSACESLSEDEDAPQVSAALVDPEPADAPQIAAYTAPNPVQTDASCGTVGAAPEASRNDVTAQKAAPNPAADGLTENRLSSLELSENTLAMDYFPEGAAELLPLETAVQPYPGGGTVYLDVPKDIYDQIQRLAVEQGMTFSCALTGDGGEENGPFTLIILEE